MKINSSRSNNICVIPFALMLLVIACLQNAVAQNTFPPTGNAGAGGPSPVTPLEVYAPVTSTFTGNARGALSIGVSGSPTNLYYRAIDFLYSDSYGPAARIAMKYDASLGSSLYFGTSNNTVGGVTNSALVIDPNGNLGIGTTAPGVALTLPYSSSGIGFSYGSSNPIVTHTITKPANGAGPLTFKADYSTWPSTWGDFEFQGASGNVIMEMLNNGNVGIGTTNPLSRLHLFSGGTTDNVLQNFQNGTSNWTMGINGASDFFRITDQTAGAARLAILNSGNVGIGTTTPAYKLDVAGAVRSSVGGFMFPDGTLQTSALSYGSTAGTAVQGNTSITVSGGDGMSGGGPLNLGTGGSLTLTNADKGSSQNIFKNVANSAGATQFSAGTNNDAVRFAGSGGTSVTFDAATKKVTIDSSGITSSQWTTSGTAINYSTGNVGIGIPNPTVALDIQGDIKLTGNINAKYQDVAEWVPASHALPAGTVVTLDPTKSNHVEASTHAYDTRVAGVVSAQPGITLGERSDNKVLVATTGRVKVMVDASSAPIQVGDLLVTSDIEGVAKKSEPLLLGGVPIHRPGTLIGKALEPLAKGSGQILVLLSLQ